jgi:hypothetical protein
VPGDAVPQPPGGLARVARTRVVLIDGLRADIARTLPQLSALCARGVRVAVDVGFPTISLPVEVALWTGLTQQQTGIVNNGDEQVLSPSLADRGIASVPAQLPDSRTLAENHEFIAASLGFARLDVGLDLDAAAVASDAALVFVHVLRVDNAGHRSGAASVAYLDAAYSADAELAELVAAAPDARWFVVSDHGHLDGGGHGGEELDIRRVDGCIAGPGIAPGRGALAGAVRVVDVARAIADSTGTHVDARSRALPLDAAIAAATGDTVELPGAAPGDAATALACLALGALATAAAARRRAALWPWWLAVAVVGVVAVRGAPTLSMPSTFRPVGVALLAPWLAGLAVAAVATFAGARRTTPARAVVAQLALPYACWVAAVTACGGWSSALGDGAAVLPRYTAWVPTLAIMVSSAAVAVALALLATLVPPASGRRERRGTARTPP